MLVFLSVAEVGFESVYIIYVLQTIDKPIVWFFFSLWLTLWVARSAINIFQGWKQREKSGFFLATLAHTPFFLEPLGDIVVEMVFLSLSFSLIVVGILLVYATELLSTCYLLVFMVVHNSFRLYKFNKISFSTG
jgi:hypothetical protein